MNTGNHLFFIVLFTILIEAVRVRTCAAFNFSRSRKYSKCYSIRN